MARIFLIILAMAVFSVQGWFLSNKDKKKDKADEKLRKIICLPVPPQSGTALNVQFFLFTRDNPTRAYDLTSTPSRSTQSRIEQSHFNSQKPTIFIIHGYHNGWMTPWVTSMAKTFLKYRDANVVCVNWKKGADSIYYGESAANTRPVGETVAKLITSMHQTTGAPYSSFHLVGHSLGAHVAGFAGESLSGKIGRISGLDPAGPCFQKALPGDRLSPDDAVFVDVIHTDGERLLKLGFGTDLSMGDVDFYPNGGEKQPGCASSFWDHLVDIFGGTALKASVSCNHLRVLELFEESINPASTFTAYPCDHWDHYATCTTCETRGCSRMGYYASYNNNGIYTLSTNEEPPYSISAQ